MSKNKNDDEDLGEDLSGLFNSLKKESNNIEYKQFDARRESFLRQVFMSSLFRFPGCIFTVIGFIVILYGIGAMLGLW